MKTKEKAKMIKTEKTSRPKLRDLDTNAKVKGGWKKTFNPQPDPPG